MALFHQPDALLTGVKERVESLAVFGNRLCLGTATGSLLTYTLDLEEDVTAAHTSTKSLSRKPIEQLAYIQDLSSIAVLADNSLNLYPFPDLVPPTPLTQARYVFSFAVNSNVERSKYTHQSPADGTSDEVPNMLTRLVVGCRRRLLVYSWRDGEMQQLQETALPFSPRSIAFVNSSVVCLVNNTSDHYIFYLDTMVLAEALLHSNNAPAATGIGSMSIGALSGIGGYMSLGLGAKAKPIMVQIDDNEVLVKKDSTGFYLGSDGKQSRESTIDWHVSPDDVAYIRPYIVSAMGAGTGGAENYNDASRPALQAPSLQIRSTLSNKNLQSFTYPFTAASSSNSASYSIKLLTTSSSIKGLLVYLTSSTDRNLLLSEGSTLWCLRSRNWNEQVDDYIERREYEDALQLLQILDVITFPEKDARMRQARILNGVSQFETGNFDFAVDTFIDLDVNPSKVVALFPKEVSGRLHTHQSSWIAIFGGREPSEEVCADDKGTAEEVDSPQTQTGSSSQPTNEQDKSSRTAIETLVRYLSDRRPKIRGALGSIHITSADSHKYPFLSETSVEELLSLPDSPLTDLTAEQLIRFAQIVDTALFKSYLVIRPKLLGPLCRLDNWCEVSEVEEVLLSREKYPELMFLYNGKRMHDKALALLKSLSDKETVAHEKVTPVIKYLQNLGPEYLDLIFESSRWVYEKEPEDMLEIFTTEQRELPRSAVADFLEEINPKECARYLEFLITERGENSILIHDRLAELYLDLTVNSARKNQDKGAKSEDYMKFLNFISSSSAYRADRLFGLLPRDDLYEARAVLLGRLDKHEAALETYVYRLHDYMKAEEYCKQIYKPDNTTRTIFLVLLKILLQPPPQYPTVFLDAALGLISRQRAHLDNIETLQLLPPLVPIQDGMAFLFDAFRQPFFNMMVLREIAKSHSNKTKGQLVRLENQRVLVTDDRICPQCHKRIGSNSVIAVHTPGGEVTHYQCRDLFAARLLGRKS